MPPSEPRPIEAFATAVPETAIAYRVGDDLAQLVDAAHPLPTTAAVGAAISVPLAGTAAANTTVGPFVPQLGRPIWVTLSGTWTGSAQLLRSTNGGTTKLPLTVAGSVWGSFSASANEPVVEESDASATYYLAITIASGTLTYRVAQ